MVVLQSLAPVVKEFLDELFEMIDRLTLHLTNVEKNPEDSQLIRAIYRDVHTIKGNASMFGLPLLGRLSHGLENVLQAMRERGTFQSSSEQSQLLFASLDQMAILARAVRDAGSETVEAAPIDLLITRLEEWYKELQSSPAARPAAKAAESPKSSAVASEEPQDSVRVSVQILDKLMNTVSELVILRNQHLERTKNQSEEDKQISQRLNLITGELQTQVMKTRMQAVGTVLNKFHRVVRDLALDLGKEIEIQIKGAETELDRALIEAIRDPLMHVVRNCADHGVETAADRAKAGKRAAGLIQVNAYQQGGYVVIEISDDGKGLDPERIRAKALERGLINAEQARSLSEKEVFALIFHAGFSTAEKVTNVSGRGVGMDVVKTNIERVGGNVELRSIHGRGTTTLLRIPLTLAIMPALLVKTSGRRFAIPQSRLVKLLHLSEDAPDNKVVETIEGQSFLLLRGRLLPLVRLNQVLHGSTAASSGETARGIGGAINIVIVSGDCPSYGLVVDEIEDSLDIVVKPLGAVLNAVSIFSGATILGDGSIALTLDITNLASYAAIDASEEDATRDPDHATKEAGPDEIDYLQLHLEDASRYVLPLCHVSRLEEIPRSEIQEAGAYRVTRYRDALLPIASLRELLGRGSLSELTRSGEKAAIVVVQRVQKSYGLEVASIVDIVSSRAEIDSAFQQNAGLLGAFIHQGQIFTVIDIFEMIERLLQGPQSPDAPRDSAPRVRPQPIGRGKSLLLAEDSKFFRRQIAALLSDSGFEVTAVEDGEKAWNLIAHQDKPSFDLIVSDIEMPGLDGLQLAQHVRSKTAWGAVPMIAVTSKFSERDAAIGRDAGFDFYLQKLNGDELLGAIEQSLKTMSRG